MIRLWKLLLFWFKPFSSSVSEFGIGTGLNRHEISGVISMHYHFDFTNLRDFGFNWAFYKWWKHVVSSQCTIVSTLQVWEALVSIGLLQMMKVSGSNIMTSMLPMHWAGKKKFHDSSLVFPTCQVIFHQISTWTNL